VNYLLATAAALALCSAASAADFTVDASKALKPVDHAAIGALYGIAAPGWPPQETINLIHPKNFVQMAPGGHQLPNGETKPVGDALIVAPIAAEAGATVTIRMPDTFPDFPYIWTGNDKWHAEVARIVAATVEANPPNIYAYEIWNEPDWTWQSQWGDFDDVWAGTFKAIRAADPARRIMGPSLSKWNADWMRRFLTAAKAAGVVPDIVSWHELDPADTNDIEAHVAAYRALEKELGLAAHPISIDEYGSQRAMGTPGALLHYIAQLERAGVYTADLAFWHRPGRLSDLLVPKTMGTGPAIDPLPNGAAWLYKWYGGMTGNMVAAAATSGSGLDGIASYDAGARRLTVLVGGASGNVTLNLKGLSDIGKAATVGGYLTHSTGTDGFEPKPDNYLHGTLPIAGDGTATLAFDLPRDTDAAIVTLYPADTVQAGVTITPPVAQRFEAETGTVTGGRKITIRAATFGANRASGDAYMGFFNKAGAALTLPISAPAAGKYDLALGYSNGQGKPQTVTLAINGGAPQKLDLLPTQGRELFGLAHIAIDLPVGASTLTLTRTDPALPLAAGPSVIELDYVDLTPQP